MGLENHNDFSKIIIGLILWILVSPILLPIVLLFSLWKGVAWFYMKVKYGTLTLEPTNMSDTAFSLSECAYMISYAMVGEGMIDLVKLRHHFYNTFIKDGKDAQYAVFHYTFITILGYTYKNLVPNLDLTRHIREEDYYYSNSSSETENEALLRIAENHSMLYGSDFPKWEMVLLHNHEEGRSTLVFKINHGLADAYSVRTLLDTFTNNAGAGLYKTPKTAIPREFLHTVKLFSKAPALMLLNYKNLKQSTFLIHPFIDDHFEKRENGRDPQSKRFWSRTMLDFNKVKKISEISGCKITAIFMSLYVSTLRETLNKLGRWNEKCVLNEAPVSYPLPVPNHPANSGHFCTHIMQAFINYPLKETSKLRQLGIIHKRLVDFDESEAGSAAMLLQTIIESIQPKFMTGITFGYFLQKPALLTIINPFIFSPTDYHIVGVKVTNLFHLCRIEQPIQTNGIMFTPLTRGDQVDVSVLGCSDLFGSQAEADLFMAILIDQVDLLEMEIIKNKIIII